MKTLVLLSSLVAFWDVVGALRLPIQGKRHQHQTLQRRASFIGTSVLTDTTDVQYSTNITLGGLPFSVLIDTGSADLWVASANPIPGAVDTGATGSVQYAVGQVQGPIQTAALQFADHTVPHQAFIFVTPDQSNADGTGLIGLGPSSGSNILFTLNSSTGNTPLDNIFLEDLTTPNFLSILLGRADEPGNPFPGDLTVGEILSGYENVTSQPQLPVTVVSLSNFGNQHWQVLLDEDGVIGPDGKPVSLTSVVSGTTNPKQLTAVFDSGFSLPQVPSDVASAFYSGFIGAQLVNITGLGGIWTLPCDQEVDFAFKMGGITYPVHPLDAVLEPADIGLTLDKNSNGKDMCVGSFQPISFDSGGTFDIILGMGFLRNTYAVFNFGDFVLGTSNTAAPYVQLLSTTNDSAKAHQDFVTVRGSDGAGPSGHTQQATTSGSTSGTKEKVESWFTRHARLIYIIGAAVVGAIILFVLAMCLCCRKRNRSNTAYSKPAFGSYAPLNAPAPAPATDMHMAPHGQPGYNQPYNQPYNQHYSEPWAPKY